MAILATPCTAPLLPALLLWASLKPAAIGVPAVVMVGVGMAFPYMILSAFPELARGIPRSGAWAELFKQMLGFMMLAAAAYFAGGRLVHGPGFWWIVVAVVAVASLYLLARTVQISKAALPVAISSILAVSLLGGILWWTARINGLLRPAAAGAAVAGNWTAFTDDAFKAARESGRPVLVKFTANWCATCQVIEGNVYQEPTVWAALRERDVVTLKADLTDSKAPGKDLLKKLNPAGGIPLTAIYPPRSDEPIVLASIYSTEALLEALRQAVPPPVARAAK
jgi:thiol:disulfide interchange protein DsbD